MNILALSDTHGLHRSLRLGSLFGVDMIIHSGDISNIGEEREVEDFLSWYHDLPAKHKVFILGNHEIGVEFKIDWIRDLIKSKYNTLTFLNHETVTLEGIKIFGSPYTPVFHDWAFNVKRSELYDYWQEIEDGTDIVITHGPPFGVGDMTRSKIHTGCRFLLERIIEVRPQIHQFGHIHEDKGIHRVQEWLDTRFVNASLVEGFPYRITSPYFYHVQSKENAEL